MAENILNDELIRRMLEEDIENPLPEEDEEVDCDHEIVSDHNSDTEEEGDNEEEEAHVGQPQVRPPTPTEFYLGKDKKTRWEMNEFPTGQAPRRNVITARIPSLSRTAKEASTEYEFWSLFMDETIIRNIVTFTNQYILNVAHNYADQSKVIVTNEMEINSFIGLLVLAGVLHAGRLNVEELWEKDGTGVEIFSATMSLQRFRFLCRSLRFDNAETREERKSVDKLAPIRELFDGFVNNCKNNFSVGMFVTVDETLVSFRGRCPFRMYMPNKPAKYGLKIFSMVDSNVFYTSNMEVYVGTQPPGPYEISNAAKDVVLRMCETIFNSGRNVTLDNWFVTYNLVEALTQKRLTVVGTVRRDKPFIPVDFVNTSRRAVHSSLFAFQKDKTIVSYIPKRNKCVLLISSMHMNSEIDESSGDLQKPQIISFYNSTKGGVDTVDQMCTEYNVMRNSRRWPLTIFFHLVNVAGINSHVLHTIKHETKLPRRKFLKNLALQLMKPMIEKRAANLRLPTQTRQLCKRLAGIQDPPRIAPEAGKRGRCHSCKDSKTRYYCKRCHSWICLAHSTMFCNDCVEDQN